ncbi:glycosyltransferase family 4 protein [Heliorestis acidaminivorans]|uniref:Glycosyltransferase family 4 protein n=1 Tax=Heliorestis acidaminivorans TaxID=553427 RepID=A0A6I0F4U2_9FIRM|nr:glycosyltransferase family 4 protein [Heliorestis acidaminivorans]KAB2954533.1 glycosyltransferase family 4 protein [Heliorestis acidaminivorans]
MHQGAVWMLTWEYPPRVMGGLGRHVADLSEALVAQGIPVHVFTCHVPGSPDKEVVNGVIVHRLHVHGRSLQEDFLGWVWQFNFALLDAILDEVGIEMPAVIHAHDWLVAMAARESQRLLHIPLVTTIHATEHGRQRGIHNDLQSYIHGVELELVSITDKLIACSEYMTREISSLFGISPAEIAIIPNGVDSKKVLSSLGDSLSIQSFVADDDEMIFYIGRLFSEKGVQVLLQAFPTILARRPKARLVIAGKGPMEKELCQWVQSSNLEQRVTFTGFIEDEQRNALLKRADVAVFPSLYEPFGIVALEAMAASVPVVASDTGGLGEIIRNGENGLKVAPNNDGQLAEAIVQVLENPQLAQRMVLKSQEELRSIYDWNKIAIDTMDVYGKAIEEAEEVRKGLLAKAQRVG